MMNKQQLIKNLGYVRYSDTDDERYNYYNKGIDTAISFAKKLAEPEKPVVPQFVADWLEVCKDNLALSLANSMNNIVMRTNNQPDKTIHWLAKNSETFAKAWLFGYEVEKEELYTVEIPNPNDFVHTILHRTEKGIIISYSTDENYKNIKQNQLTEAEIKQDFEWAWQFAEKVEEND